MIDKIKNIKGLFLEHPNGEAVFNMASDEWLLEQMINGAIESPLIVKLYSWSDPAITFGYNQSEKKAVDYTLLDKNIRVIRRVTGGRAIYHDRSELTVTVVLNLRILPQKKRSIRFTNQLISEILVEAFENSGIHTNWARKSDAEFSSTKRKAMKSCFGSLSEYELTSGLQKIAAGAQRKFGDFLIHQGSLKILGVTACKAINQVAVDSVGFRNADFNFADFSTHLLSSFEKKIGIELKKRNFFGVELEEIENKVVNLLEKMTQKRRID